VQLQLQVAYHGTVQEHVELQRRSAAKNHHSVSGLALWKSAASERYDMTVRRGARAARAIGAGTEAGEAADQRHASPVDFFFWGVPATAASPKACMYPCPAAPLRLWPLLTVPLRPRYAHTIFVLVVHGTGATSTQPVRLELLFREQCPCERAGQHQPASQPRRTG